MRALVVDDSRAIRGIVGRIVKEAGFDVVEAANGREALDRLREAGGSIGLALVDWNMPVMDGLELVKAVRGDGAYGDLAIIMVTTEAEAAQVEQALEAGANEYLMKPFNKEALAEKLALLGLSAAADDDAAAA